NLYNYIKLLTAIIGVLLLFLFKNNIFTVLKETIPLISNNYVIIQRVQALSDFILIFTLQVSLKARINDLNLSFQTFLENPIWGKGYIISSDIYSTGIGMHSHFLDDLARFGLFNFLIQILVYYVFYKFVSLNLERKIKR